ncbi:MAG: hypothetical protein R3Y36_05980 [Spirochaetales bacterium]
MRAFKKNRITQKSSRVFLHILFYATCSFLILFFSSCSFRSTAVSIDERLAQVDSLIAVRQYNDAWSLLRRIAKDVRNPYDSLGIVRRSLLLDKTDYAKTLLAETLKTYPENQELIAVYTHILMTENLYEEALEYGVALEAGSYGSLYSELRFRTDSEAAEKAYRENPSENLPQIPNYYSPYYAQAYADIAGSTGNVSYLRNAALVYALQGDMSKAFFYHPKNVTSYDDPWFWAQISYDSYNFTQAIQDVLLFDLSAENLALLADSYLQENMIENAKNAWLFSTQIFSGENPFAWHNLAQYYYNIGDPESAHLTLTQLVDQFPYYVPGLTAYAYFSLSEPVQSSDTIFYSELEKRGMQTLQMTRASAVLPITTDDALMRIEIAEEFLHTQDSQEAIKLAIEKTKLRWEISGSALSATQKTADILLLLEKYGQDSLLVEYALWQFFSFAMIDDADQLFRSHCSLRYENADTDIQFRNVPLIGMESWEYEFGAYIALCQKRYGDAEEWFRFLIPDGIPGEATPINAALNFIELHNSSGRRGEALELYKKILSITDDNRLKAEISYKIALIQYETGEIGNAVFSLNQALLFNEGHNHARILLRQINNN